MAVAFPGESAEYRAAAEHVCQRVNLAVAAKAPLDRILTFASERGWRRLRLLSSALPQGRGKGRRRSQRRRAGRP